MKKSLLAVLRTLEAAPSILSDFTSAIPSDALRAIRRPGFWSIEQHLFHLADTQPMLYERLRRFRDETSPSFVPFLPGSGQAQPLASKVASVHEALSMFGERRAKMLELVRGFSDEVWDRVGSHPEYSTYTCFGLLRHITMHDHWHMYRIEELWLTRDEYLTEVQ